MAGAPKLHMLPAATLKVVATVVLASAASRSRWTGEPEWPSCMPLGGLVCVANSMPSPARLIRPKTSAALVSQQYFRAFAETPQAWHRPSMPGSCVCKGEWLAGHEILPRKMPSGKQNCYCWLFVFPSKFSWDTWTSFFLAQIPQSVITDAWSQCWVTLRGQTLPALQHHRLLPANVRPWKRLFCWYNNSR